MKHSLAGPSVLAIAALLAAPTVRAQGQDDAEKLRKTVDKTIDIEKNTQEARDEWATEKAGLIQRYRTANANIGYLEQRRSSLTDEAQAIEAAIADLERRLGESDQLNATLQDTLVALVTRLENRVASDIPFLIDERTKRIEALRADVVSPDVTGAEKLRRVLESLEVEAGYGGTVEAHNDEIEVNGETLFVDLLRIGRVSVFWRTADGKRVGEYDRATGEWRELPGKYARNISSALEMASRRRPIEIISLPLGRIVP